MTDPTELLVEPLAATVEYMYSHYMHLLSASGDGGGKVTKVPKLMN